MLSNIWDNIYNALDLLWGWPLFIFVLFVGFLLSFRTGFFQIIGIKTWWKKTVGELFSKDGNSEKGVGQLTPWQSITTVLGGTIGSGNIAGVATAIYSGGPGAIFWMWVVALLSMIIKMCEVSLAVNYRKKGEDGEYYGGPMYYMKGALGKFGKILAGFYAAIFLLDIINNACIIQVSTLASSIEEVFGFNEFIIILIVSIITLIIIILGGVKKVGQVSSAIVPPMILIYFVGCMGVIIANIHNLPLVFRDIFACAFGAKPVLGGVAGYSVTVAIAKGTSRGIFSNEAGTGSSATVHATAKTDHPIHQGMYGIFEVFIDTIIVCSLTGLTILCANILSIVTEETAGVGMVLMAFEGTWGYAGKVLLCIAVTLFCYSGYLGFYVDFRTCNESLFGHKIAKYLNFSFFIFPLAAVYLTTLEIWSLCELTVGLIIIPNLLAIILLNTKFADLFKEYMAKIRNKKVL